MNVQQQALERIKSSSINGEKLAELFQMMAQETSNTGGACGTFTIDYEDVDSGEDGFIPQIVLVLRPKI